MNTPLSSEKDLTIDCNINLPHLLLMVLVSVIGGLLFGFDSGVVNGALGGLQKTFQMSEAMAGFSVASTLLGCALGALVSGHWADKQGRKPVMLWTAILFFASSIWSGLSFGSIDFVISRVLAGIAIGGASVITPTYISEISPPTIRGRLGSLQQLAIVVGLFGAFISNYAIIKIAGSSISAWVFGLEAWRWMFIVGAFPAVIFALGVIIIPESPRYLVSLGKDLEAIEILKKISSIDAVQCVKEIQESLKTKPSHSWRDLLDPITGRLQSVVVIGLLFAAFQQLTGINVVFYYGAVLWEAVGFKESDALLINILSGTINITATLFAICLIDRVGRIPLLKWGSLGVFLSLSILASIFLMAPENSEHQLALTKGQGYCALIAANLFVFIFGISWGPVLWVLLGEMFENRNRGSAMALSTTTLWITNFGITLMFPIFLKSFGIGSIYVGFSVVNFIAFLFVMRFLKETKNQKLEKIVI